MRQYGANCIVVPNAKCKDFRMSETAQAKRENLLHALGKSFANLSRQSLAMHAFRMASFAECDERKMRASLEALFLFVKRDDLRYIIRLANSIKGKKMDILDFYRLAKACQWGRVTRAKKEPVNLALIRDLYGKSRAQTYRDLMKAIRIGFIRAKEMRRGKMPCTSYELTRDGIEFIEDIKKGEFI